MSLTPEILARLADELVDKPWAVYAAGIGTAFICSQDHGPLEPCRVRFDRLSATAFADQLRANVNSARRAYGIDAIPEITPYVLCYGIVWEQR